MLKSGFRWTEPGQEHLESSGAPKAPHRDRKRSLEAPKEQLYL